MTRTMSEPGRAAVNDARLADEPPWHSVGDLVRDARRRFGDREALRFGDRRMSFTELDDITEAVAGEFDARGVKPGNRVAIMVPNGLEFPVCWLGLLKLGAVAVPVNTRLKSADLTHLLTDAAVCLTITSADLTAAAEAVASTSVVVATDIIEAASGGRVPEAPAVTPERLANLQYTSGTTGLPKACMLTHDYWLRTGWLAAGISELGPDDVVMTAQPFTYMDPPWNLVMCLIGGAPLVILPRFSASGFWPSAREHAATVFYVLGTMPHLLLRQPPHPSDRDNRVRLVLCSGIVPALHQRLEARWGAPWREVFGMTETGVDLAARSWENDTVGSGTVGRPVPTKEARILDASATEVPVGQAGELCVRGRPMMTGYWNRPEATAATIRDGWLYTGDLAKLDESGRVYLVGRKKDMVRRGGENIACAEVEAVVLQQPAVASVALVAEPDDLWGEEPKAFVQLIPEQAPDAATARAILDFARERLARFKVPRYIEFVSDFPRTPSEKIDKPRLLADHRPAPVYDALENAMVSATAAAPPGESWIAPPPITDPGKTDPCGVPGQAR